MCWYGVAREGFLLHCCCMNSRGAASAAHREAICPPHCSQAASTSQACNATDSAEAVGRMSSLDVNMMHIEWHHRPNHVQRALIAHRFFQRHLLHPAERPMYACLLQTKTTSPPYR